MISSSWNTMTQVKIIASHHFNDLNDRDHWIGAWCAIISKDPRALKMDAVIARIHEAAELVPLKNLGIQLNVVFASTAVKAISWPTSGINYNWLKQLLIKFGYNKKKCRDRLACSLFMSIQKEVSWTIKRDRTEDFDYGRRVQNLVNCAKRLCFT